LSLSGKRRPRLVLNSYVSQSADLFHKIFGRSKILCMRIMFERSGGFSGRKIQGSLDSSMLPVSEARRLTQLVEQSHFFELPPILESAEPGADRFNYRVTVESEKGRHTVEASEAAVPGPMRPLLEFLARSVASR
jgi:hypothetical protein